MVFHNLQQHIASLLIKIRPFSIRYVALVTTISLLASFVHVRAQQPTDTLAGERTKFIGKISHWLAAYGASGEDFMREKRNAFKSAAFAEVYIEGIIDHPAWMFTMLNRVTQAKYAEKQTPYILFGVKFKPQDDNLDSYEISLSLQEGSAIAPQRDDGIVSNASAKHLGGKTYAEPVAAEADLEKAIGEALDGLQAKLGNSLAPKLMVRYQDEVFWNGHEIPILDAEGNSVELEAIDRDGALLSPDEITWTNADPFQSRGVVDMTGTQTKAVTLSWGNDAITVTLNRVSVSQDINELLKALIIEALSAKKQEAADTLAILKLDSAANATEIQRYLAGIDAGNFPLEGNGNLAPMFETPIVRSDSTALFQNNDIGPNLLALRQRKKVRSAIRRKVNVVALADLIVDHPDRVTILLDELLRSSGQLVARIILNRDSQGQRTELRNIVLDFLNKNLERVAGNHYPSSLSQEPPLVIPPVTAQQPTFDPQKFLYVNPRMSFPGKDQLIQQLTADVPPATYVFINYSQDVNLTSYQARAKGTRPMGLPQGTSYRVFTVLHMPGSLLEVHLTDEPAPFNPYQYLIGRNVIAGPFSAHANGDKGFSFLTVAGKIITIPLDAQDVTFNENGLLTGFTIAEDSVLQRYLSTNYTGTEVFAGMRKTLDADTPPYKESISKGLPANPKVYLAMLRRTGEECGIDLYSSTFNGQAPESNTGGDREDKAEASTIASRLNDLGGASTNPVYGSKIKLEGSNVSVPDGCDLCNIGMKFAERFSPYLDSESEYQALLNTAKRICEFNEHSPGTDLIAAFTADGEEAKKKLSSWMFTSTDPARLKAMQEDYWKRSDAWQIYYRRLEEYLDFYFALKSHNAFSTWPNDKVKAIINARSQEFLNLYTLEERIGIIQNLLPSTKPSVGFQNIDDQFVGNGEEAAIIKVLKSVTEKGAADQLLTALSKDSFLQKLNFHIDDIGLGDNNYTALSNQFQRLALLRAGVDPSVKITAAQWKDHVAEKNHFIYNDTRTFAFGSVKPEDGAVYYRTVTYDANGDMTIEYDVCEETSSHSYEVSAGRGETRTKTLVTCAKTSSHTKAPHYFDLVSIDVIELDFLSPETNADLGRAVVTYAGFLDYIEEKKGTDQAITITEYTINTASLVFGVGEIALIIKFGATAGRIALATVDLGSQVADLVIGSDAFAAYVCSGEEGASPEKNCPELERIRQFNTLAQLAAIVGSGFDLAQNWSALNPTRFARFARYTNLRKMPASVLSKLDAENWGDDLLRSLDQDLADVALKGKVIENPVLVDSWKKLLKEGNAVSDVLRKDTKVLEWVSKQGNNIPQSALDDLLAQIDRRIKETIEDAQGRMTFVLDRPGQSNKVVSVHPTASGQFKTTTYSPAYNPDLNPNTPVPLSRNKLVPDYAGTQYMNPLNQGKVIRIELSGNRTTDFARARAELKRQLGLDPSDVLDETGYTWHHLDDFEVSGNKPYSTMQLVESSAHQGTGVTGMQHSGSVAQYQAYHGSGY